LTSSPVGTKTVFRRFLAALRLAEPRGAAGAVGATGAACTLATCTVKPRPASTDAFTAAATTDGPLAEAKALVSTKPPKTRPVETVNVLEGFGAVGAGVGVGAHSSNEA
jgi:hypothetical protein